jgi:hypothetical protein
MITKLCRFAAALGLLSGGCLAADFLAGRPSSRAAFFAAAAFFTDLAEAVTLATFFAAVLAVALTLQRRLWRSCCL